VASHLPQKRFGQHFLSDQRTLDRIVKTISPSESSVIVEIGPGEGALTLPLAKGGAQVVAVEFDRDLIRPLEKKLSAYPKVQIIRQDFLEFVPDQSLGRFVLAGNIPYNITSPIIDWCSRFIDRTERVVLMIQREMAKRICGKPGTKDWAPISIITQLHFDVTYEFEVPPTAFTPPPEVHSAVITLTPRADRPVVDMARFDRLLRASFGHRRKLLANNLIPEICPTSEDHAKYLQAIGARPDCRAEQVTIDQFIALTELLIRDGRL
jgi:16S rRNA (adenine1518-N6/adenine1519-N6)-dimethyltransferase